MKNRRAYIKPKILIKVENQSNNWHRQRKKVATFHFKVKCQRNDYHHQLSTYLVRKYDTICIEGLKASNMMRNRKLFQHIGDVGWRMFREILAYKCKWSGENLVVLNMWISTSKQCSNCGNIKKQLKLSERIYRCTECHIRLDRDFNAAINIKKISLNLMLRKDNRGQGALLVNLT
ncbi:MAG: RNA-guided endonuclease InsQ/TnpB family protein [Chitinophagales bacterium]